MAVLIGATLLIMVMLEVAAPEEEFLDTRTVTLELLALPAQPVKVTLAEARPDSTILAEAAVLAPWELTVQLSLAAVLESSARSSEPNIIGAAAAAARHIPPPSRVVMAATAVAAAALSAQTLVAQVLTRVALAAAAHLILRLILPEAMLAPALAAVAVAARIITALIKAATAALVLWLCAQSHQ